MDNCQICNHKEHDLGQCKKCNCGESEIMHSKICEPRYSQDTSDYLFRIYTNPQNTVRYEKGAYKLCQ